MFNMIDYYYKGYDIENINTLEKKMMEYNNPYGYNLESNERRVRNRELEAKRTNQDLVKNKSIRSK